MKKGIGFLIAWVLIFNVFTPSLYGQKEINNTEIEDFLNKSFKAANYKDASVIITDRNKVIFDYGYGNIVNNDEQFVIGSISKSFTALAIMKLVDEKKINLSDKVSQYLTEEKELVDVVGDITIIELLNQTSGIQSYHFKDVKKIEDRNSFYYSNVNYGLLGKIIENVSNMSYEEYMTKNIFEAMNLTNTFATTNENKEINLIPSYKSFFGFNHKSKQTWDREHLSSGYIISSANDMAKYLRMLINSGKSENEMIITEEINAAIFNMNHLIEEDKPGSQMLDSTAYGMGWFVGKRYNQEIYTHGGNVENYSSSATILPENGLGIIILVNSDDMLVGQKMLNEISSSLNSYLITNDSSHLKNLSTQKYWCIHFFVNIILIFWVAFGLWQTRITSKFRNMNFNRAILSIFIKVILGVFPFVFLLLLTKSPFDVILGFGTDIIFSLGLAFFLILFGTLRKSFLLIKKKNKM